MKAITLHQPWAWCIAHSGKRIENRSWAPWPQLFGERIAIHAGKAWDAIGMDWLIDERAIQWPPSNEEYARMKLQSAIVCTAVIAAVVRESANPWFAGPIGWVLRDVETLVTPVPCRGMQGLWTVPPQVEAEIAAAEKVPGVAERLVALMKNSADSAFTAMVRRMEREGAKEGEA
jgi:hypothetical protein